MGCIINEEIIEKILMKNGYKIISPGYLSLQEQVQLISTSDIISGFDGSQFFTLLFAEEISSKFYVFNRRPKIPGTIPYVFQKRNVEFELYHFDVEYVAGEGAWSYYNHPQPKKTLKYLCTYNIESFISIILIEPSLGCPLLLLEKYVA